jgi:organic hydroperoxide reductase OsmC/OhrA
LYRPVVAPPRAKEFHYVVALDRTGRIDADGDAPLELPDAWTPEHLVLAGLVRCTLTSLRHHARKAGIEVDAAGSASGTVTRREDDGRYAFVEIAVRLAVELHPAAHGEQLKELLAKAERDCFIGASLTVAPSYEWNVA